MKPGSPACVSICLMPCLQNASKREPDIVQRRSEALLEGFLEKALATVFPSEQQFPFTAKLSAEMLAIDGASATAALEGASLALMDAGVPSRSRHASDLVAGARLSQACALRGIGWLLEDAGAPLHSSPAINLLVDLSVRPRQPAIMCVR